MASKSANLYVRIEPQVKTEAEQILEMLGLSASSAVNMFYRQIILNRGLPFAVQVPAVEKPLDMSTLTEAEFNAEIEKGYADIKAGRVRPAEEAFADIRREYQI